MCKLAHGLKHILLCGLFIKYAMELKAVRSSRIVNKNTFIFRSSKRDSVDVNIITLKEIRWVWGWSDA